MYQPANHDVRFLSNVRHVLLELPSLSNIPSISLEGMRTPLEVMLVRARILSSPLRLTLWFALGRDGMRPSELARTYDVAASTVRYHMLQLMRERLVEVVGAGAHRVYRWTSRELVLATRDELAAAGLA